MGTDVLVVHVCTYGSMSMERMDLKQKAHTKSEILSGTTLLLLEPEGHGIRPTLTHTTSFGGGQASTGAAASHAVGDTVRHLVGDDVIFKITVALGF